MQKPVYIARQVIIIIEYSSLNEVIITIIKYISKLKLKLN